ncbi:saccharopine dehydrogenase NADP-binding domain-containing protein [Nocardioides sp. YIM 152315]|uniref:saccharopine dehydrogenase family protein n=1 Tax=Nocardioides sp. YIM 152315 TaxID=3031760 RepID=UPI0023DAC528|nr:saccharopine dehydrogenase NADP-binding domain-containing protein [Nocardioides sp. YIM 152315]MDF1604292.1 saccharopine dehydrogenase NADP-binding domain-containing protein [Nocardioides sp. YIM 152315]
MNTSERASAPVLVYGATGHTGRFVVDELLRRGVTPVLAGRDAERLAAVAPDHGLEVREVGLDDRDRLRRAASDVGAVVNCAGPFLDTAVPLARAAVGAGAHYLDLTAEQSVVRELYRRLDAPARHAGVAVVPAMAFYGGLADLLVTSVLDGDTRADAVDVAIGLDHWWPTAGTRVTGHRNTATRQVIRAGRLAPLADPAPTRTWSFREPLGDHAVVELPFSEVLTIHRHLRVGELRSHLNAAPLQELRDPTTPAPSPTDGSGRSAQRFTVEVVVRRGAERRRVSAEGRDIYAVSAPIVVEGAVRLLDGRGAGAGALAPGQAFDADDVLRALEREAPDFRVCR